MSRADDAITALAHTLDALDDHVRVSDATVRRSERNRLSLLHAHALFACLIALLFAALGPAGMSTASWVVLRLIPGMPFTLAALLFAGGLILGVATWNRHITGEMVGLWLLMAWYATISLGFAGAAVVWLANGSPQGAAKPSFYPAGVYAHIWVVLAVHQHTLRRIRRSRREAL